MDQNLDHTAASGSLVTRDIYSVCCTQFESIDRFHDGIYGLRKRFFAGGRHNCHTSTAGTYLGYDCHEKGALGRHSLRWKKTVNGVRTEEAFSVSGMFVVVIRDMNGSICGKIHFDRENRWVKTEYFSSTNYKTASSLVKPGEVSDTAELFTYNEKRKNYDSQILFPVPYLHGSGKQSAVNAAFGDALVLVSTAEGEFCYCPQEEQQARLQALEGDTPAEPTWEATPEEADALPPEETGPVFTDLYETARAEAPCEEDPIPEELPPEASLTDEDLILEIEESAAVVTEDFIANGDVTIVSQGQQFSYTGKLISGLREGRGRTDQPGGLTVFDGQYHHGLKQGFGSSYYMDGNLSYVGLWKEDKRDGAGISFRENDHAMHLTTWKNGKPSENATLFDPQGNLKYCGRIVDGKKQGAGFSQSLADGTVFVGKYKGDDCPKDGALFDLDGNLLYTGGWKNGKRDGHGTEFDRGGNIVYSGQWRDDRYLNGILYKKIDENEA